MRRLLPLLVLCAAVAVPVSGCGTDDIDPSAAVAQAADKTAAVEGMHMTLTTKVSGQTIQGEGFVDPVKMQADVTMELPGVGQLQIITDQLKIYMKFPDGLADEDLTDGKTWLSVDLAKALKGGGIDLQSLTNTGGSDAAAQLRQLKAMGDIETVGTEDVGGVSTTHYKGTVDLLKAADLVPESDRAVASASAKKIVELNGGRSQVPTELWIDDEGHVRQVRQTTPTEAGDVESTVEYSDFGTTEAIEIPPAADTHDMTDEAAEGLS